MLHHFGVELCKSIYNMASAADSGAQVELSVSFRHHESSRRAFKLLLGKLTAR